MSTFSNYGPLIGAIDQGTSNTKFLIFSSVTLEVVTYHQVPVTSFYPKEGWVEQDPLEILASVELCIAKVTDNLKKLDVDFQDIKALGITNQRETTIVWNKMTGLPLYNAIVWNDVRTSQIVENLINITSTRKQDYFQEICGLPLSTYFSSVKIKWLQENVKSVQENLEKHNCLFGTVDSWLIWNLTGGIETGIHVTDVTNASRTMLMNLRTLQWDEQLCRFFNVPIEILPKIKSCSEIYGTVFKGPLQGVPIAGCLGDQQAALVGHCCFKEGMGKNTYGTGCFFVCNTGRQIIFSSHGLITTVAYQMGKNSPPIYALEGSVAVAGDVITWLKDNLKIINNVSEAETLANSVPDSGGVYFVPAFSGLLAPYWKPNARGIICGLSHSSKKEHIIRAALESVCFQLKDIIEVIKIDGRIQLTELWVDGGMAVNNFLLQRQSDLLGVPIVKPSLLEITSLGAAIAAGCAEEIAVWDLTLDTTKLFSSDRFFPSISEFQSEILFENWHKAVDHSFDWENSKHRKDIPDHHYRLVASIPGTIFILSSFMFLLLSNSK